MADNAAFESVMEREWGVDMYTIAYGNSKAKSGMRSGPFGHAMETLFRRAQLTLFEFVYSDDSDL